MRTFWVVLSMIRFRTIVGSVLLLSACATGGNVQRHSDKGVGQEAPDFQKRGQASFYGGDFHGKQTANGERYNMHAMTAAHKTLPFGTRVRVTCKETGKSVIVRINDRGPFVAGRIIDVSYGAAGKLGIRSKGVVNVKIELAD